MGINTQIHDVASITIESETTHRAEDGRFWFTSRLLVFKDSDGNEVCAIPVINNMDPMIKVEVE